mgnify:CR=1 FL=1
MFSVLINSHHNKQVFIIKFSNTSPLQSGLWNKRWTIGYLCSREQLPSWSDVLLVTCLHRLCAVVGSAPFSNNHYQTRWNIEYWQGVADCHLHADQIECILTLNALFLKSEIVVRLLRPILSYNRRNVEALHLNFLFLYSK